MTNAETNYLTPTPCGFGQEAISRIAEYLSADLQYEPGQDLTEVVENLGGDIAYQDLFDLDASRSGSIQVDGDNDFQIFLAKHTSAARDRFTICHELGHYFLHYVIARANGSEIPRLRAERYGSGPCEYEANWFAAAFLMPSGSFTASYQDLAGNIDLLASRFGVSTQAASIRASVLNLNGN